MVRRWTAAAIAGAEEYLIGRDHTESGNGRTGSGSVRQSPRIGTHARVRLSNRK
jgi:hypothetical protein